MLSRMGDIGLDVVQSPLFSRQAQPAYELAFKLWRRVE